MESYIWFMNVKLLKFCRNQASISCILLMWQLTVNPFYTFCSRAMLTLAFCPKICSSSSFLHILQRCATPQARKKWANAIFVGGVRAFQNRNSIVLQVGDCGATCFPRSTFSFETQWNFVLRASPCCASVGSQQRWILLCLVGCSVRRA